MIRSKINPDRIYIGSAVKIYHRWKKHLSELRLNRHHSRKLQFSFNKHGEYDLEFSILETCDPELLIEKEQFYIDRFNPFFNCNPTAGSPLGIKRSNETKEKLRIAGKKRIHPPVSDETRLKMSESKKLSPTKTQFKKGCKSLTEGTNRSEETKNKIRASLKGKCYNDFSKEHRKKLSEGAREMWKRRKEKIIPEPW